MKSRLILHDLPPKTAAEDLSDAKGTPFWASQTFSHCMGCFGCWLKTPGKCVLKDEASQLAVLMPEHEELVIISRLTYGGLSGDVKAVLDRSIGFMLPFFRLIDGASRHQKRYEGALSLRYLFYGAGSEEEQKTARTLTEANAKNLAAKHWEAAFFEHPHEIGEVLR